MKRSAIIKDGYRYFLSREWDNTLPIVTFIMLSPGEADHKKDDCTLLRCIELAKNWGYGKLYVINLFAYITKLAPTLRHIKDPVGLYNHTYIKSALKAADKVVVAWGNSGVLYNANLGMLKLLETLNITPHCLGVTKEGHPKYPLHIKKDAISEIYSYTLK